MKIIITNISADIITIPDLAIQLNPTESVDLISYNVKDLLSSSDLPSIFTSGSADIKIDGTSVNWSGFVTKLTSVTIENHEALHSLKHNIAEDSFFETTKEDGKTKLITYYADSTKSSKLREEEITRDNNGKVASIITRNYDGSGNIETTETQKLNRDATTGKVKNITIAMG